jgi:hypothetical protein
MAQRKIEVKMKTTGYERHHAEGGKTRRRHGKGERELEKVVYWTDIQSAKKVGGKRDRGKRRMRRSKGR